MQDEHNGSIARLGAAIEQIKDQLSRVIVGQHDVIEQMLIALFARGHCLLEGVPGLAKTLLVSTLARSLNLTFSRIQFTPDLMPADITGTDIIEENRSTGQREMRFLAGPIFSHVILADEINRTPPKTQAALLEAMQERQVTVGRIRHQMSDPFLVLATQNPIEQEGTYPLPEAQQDRFMFKVLVTYPSFRGRVRSRPPHDGQRTEQVEAVLSPDEIRQLQELVRAVPISDHLIRYTLALVRQTRVRETGVPEFVTRSIGLGRRPAGHAVPDSRRQSPRAHLRPAPRGARRHPRPRQAGAPPSPRREFRRRKRRRHHRPHHRRLLEVTPTHEDELIHDDRFQKIFAS